jgi:hypothetical protein
MSQLLHFVEMVAAGFSGISGPSATFFGPSEGHDSAVVSAGGLRSADTGYFNLCQLRWAAWAWGLRFKCRDRRS